MGLKEYINENNKKLSEGTFDTNSFEKIIDDGITSLWKAFNILNDLAPNYLKKNGQGGTISAFRKKLKLDELEKIINNIESSGSSKK